MKPIQRGQALDHSLCGKGAVVSPEIETVLALIVSLLFFLVARERWSRLRLKRPTLRCQRGYTARGKGAVVSPEIETILQWHDRRVNGSGKGAVVSPEIETEKLAIVSGSMTHVARERWSRLRLKLT